MRDSRGELRDDADSTVGRGNTRVEFLLIWLLFGIFSGILASQKGRSGCGWFAVGILLGPFGLLVALIPAVTPSAASTYVSYDCPGCGAILHSKDFTRCPLCKYELTSAVIDQAITKKSGLPAGSSFAGARTIEERLQALNELRDKGVISTEEYDRQRATILNEV